MRSSLAHLCHQLDPASLVGADVVTAYEAFADMEKLVAGAKLRLAVQVERSGAWRRAGHRDPAQYLAGCSGGTGGAARDELATSRRLADLPATEDAVRRGALSSQQATAIADAAAAAPEAERRLLDQARRSSLRDLRDACARAKAAADPDADARHQRIHRERSLRTFTDRDGAWNLHARGPAEAGAAVMAALSPLVEAQFRAARAEGRREPHEAYAFDGLVALARGGPATVAPGPPPTPSGDPATGPTPTADEPSQAPVPAPASPSSAAPTNLRHLALLRVDLEALVRGAVEGDELCELTGIGPVPARTARQLLGDAIIKLVITRGQDVATIVHLGRGPNAAQRVALLWSQPGCSRLGCDQPWTRTEADHRTPWAESHQTTLDQLDLLCPHDHDLKTHHGWGLVEGKGKRLMVPPGHPFHPSQGPPGRGTAQACLDTS